MCVVLTITHTSRFTLAQDSVKKQRRVGQEKMVGKWSVGKTAVLAVLLNCIVSGTTIIVPSYEKLVCLFRADLACVKVHSCYITACIVNACYT